MIPSRATARLFGGGVSHLERALPLGLPDSRERLEAESLDALAERVAHGDTAAFEAIYRQLADDIYRFIRGQCESDLVAEDLLSNVFLKAWRFAARYRPRANTYRQWLFAISRNEVRDHWRASQPTIRLGDLDVADPTDTSRSRDVDDAMVVVAKALQKLTPLQREVVVLRYFGDKSHAEIAEALGKREGAVRGLLTRAMHQMRKAIRDAAP